MQYSMCHNESHDICRRDSGAPNSGWIWRVHSYNIPGFRFPVHFKFATAYGLKPIAASSSEFDSRHLSCTRFAAGTSNATYQITSSRIVLNNTQEQQWNPTLAISNSRYNNSKIRKLIHINIEDRRIRLSNIVSLTNDLFLYLYQLRRLCWLNV
jgi:hypothetical protein